MRLPPPTGIHRRRQVRRRTITCRTLLTHLDERGCALYVAADARELGATWTHSSTQNGIPRIIVGENRTFQGPEDYVRSAAHPPLWNEDIGM